MCTISDQSVWKLYLVLTDGKTLPTIKQHMAKIFPFLESKADIFSSYLPISDINLAKEKSIWHGLLCPYCCALPVCIFGWYTVSDHHIFLLMLDSGWHSKLILMWMWRQPVVIIISKPSDEQLSTDRRKLNLQAREFLAFFVCILLCHILELSIIYIKNDMRIISQFISITISDMLNVQCCWQWQFITWCMVGKQTWSRLSIAIIKHHWMQHLLTLLRSQFFPHVRKMGTI